MIKVFTVRCQGRNCGTVEQLSATAFILWSFLSHYLERRKEQSSFKEEVKKEEINVRKIKGPFFINTYICIQQYLHMYLFRLLPFGRISSQSFQKNERFIDCATSLQPAMQYKITSTAHLHWLCLLLQEQRCTWLHLDEKYTCVHVF